MIECPQCLHEFVNPWAEPKAKTSTLATVTAERDFLRAELVRLANRATGRTTGGKTGRPRKGKR